MSQNKSLLQRCECSCVPICGLAAVPKCVPAALPCPAGVLAALAAAVLADLLPCLPGVLAPTRPNMVQDKRYTVPTLPKMSQHSQKWPKISPIWSQLLPNKGQYKPIPLKWPNISQIWCQRGAKCPNMAKTLAQQRPTQTTKYTKMAQHEPNISNMVPT